ncbi:PqiA/YebS family transporter subunit [Roseomonas sp. NAR14]|uniref:PqiA/YebS family transporter subunit n=1 Tax=Roseomonas acroporae TaxID=2937791 RepID=A0A9X1Y6Q4_9PROT|nr:PqiA/YebS family transporter subunit [Roseomonas acroporae]MCK8783092.1 PqiA/YebS family transporter subunit [Roseomonas acroporae]
MSLFGLLPDEAGPGRPNIPVLPGRRLRECPHCGKLLHLRPLPPDTDARCPRCDAVLRRNRSAPLTAPLALGCAAFALYLVTMMLPFLELHLLGRPRLVWVASGADSLTQEGYWALGALVLATLVLVPLLKLLLLLTVLVGLRLPRPPRWLHLPFRWYRHIAPWAMLEVFLFGALVSYTRLVDLADVQIGAAAIALGALSLLLVATDSALDPEAIWEMVSRRHLDEDPALVDDTRPGAAATAAPAVPAAPGPRAARAPLIGCHCCHLVSRGRDGDHCPRCGSRLHRRKPNSIARTWALITAAVVLYVPANYYPVMNVITLGQGGPHTILGGVEEFIESGFWPLALIVFLASVAVPMLKLLGLLSMLLGVHARSDLRLRDRTRLYRVVDAIGRWSMIDVFVVSVLVSVVHFGRLANIVAENGALCFAGVVILTMFAAEAFDPRLMWDAVPPHRRDRAGQDRAGQDRADAYRAGRYRADRDGTGPGEAAGNAARPAPAGHGAAERRA